MHPTLTTATLLGTELIVADDAAEIRALLCEPRRHVHWLRDDAAPLAQITRALAGARIDTLHLVAHGRVGAVWLGGAWIDAAALRASTGLLAGWGVERIVLWSCEAGHDDGAPHQAGAGLIRTLADLTGAEVLASHGPLGRGGPEGDARWQLDAHAGRMTTWPLPHIGQLVSPDHAAAWPHALGLITVSFAGGFVGANTGNNSSSPAYSFSEMGWTNVQFTQNSNTNVFVAQGNDIIGTILITDQAGVEHAIPGFIKWRTPSGNSPSTMVFQPSSSETLATDNVGSFTGSSYAIDPYVNSGNAGDYVGLTFNGQSLSFSEGGSVTGNAATSGLLDALNTYLAAQPQLTVGDASVGEAAGTMTFTITLSAASADTVTVKYETHDGTAADGSDYTAVATGTLTFLPGQTSKTVVVSIADDADAESSETLTLLLHDPTFAAIGDDSGLGTIVDNDSGGAGSLLIGSISGHTTEAGGTATFTVALSAAPASNVTVSVGSNDGTEGSVAPTTLTFTPANWATPQTVTASGIDDSLDDGSITFQVDLTSSSADTAFDGLTGNVSVVNDDDETAALVLGSISRHTTEAGQTASFTVALAAQPTSSVTVSVATGDATEGTVSTSALTFTPANWATPQTVTVTGADDALDDGDIGYQVNLGASSADAAFNGLSGNVAVVNDDDETAALVLGSISRHTTEAGQTASFTVALAAQPTSNVTVSVATGDATEGTVSTSTLTFTPANWATPQTVTVTGADDALDDGDIGYQVNLGASSADAAFNGLSGNVAVVNDDDETAALVLGSISRHTTEAGQTASFTVALAAQPTSNVTVSVATGDATEGTVSNSTLTFTPANWATPQTVTVTGADDALDDGDIGYQVNLGSSSADAAFNGLSGNVAVVNDDDDVPALLVGTISRHTHESGVAATFTVALSAQPTSNVTISVASSDTGEGTVGTSTLTFTPANWSTPQSVTVTGADDVQIDGSVASQVNLVASSGDAGFDGLTGSVAVINDDNDRAALVLGSVSRATSEAGDGAQFSVRLSAQPSATVTVAVASDDASEGEAGPATLTFTPANWNTPQTVTVTGLDDPSVDGDMPYSVQLSATSSDDDFDQLAASATLVNTDNDIAGLVIVGGPAHTAENGAAASFGVRLASRPVGPVTVSIHASDATEGEVLTTTLIFTPDNWQQPQQVDVRGVDDAEVDGTVAYTVHLQARSSDNAYDGLAGVMAATNADDDHAGVQFDRTALRTSEAGASGSATLHLASKPAADVVISFEVGNEAEGTLRTQQLRFTPQNWDQPQTVEVSGRDDQRDDGDVSHALRWQAKSADMAYQDLAGQLAVINADDDGAGLVVGSISRHTREDGGSATFPVHLASQPTGTVTVAVTSLDSTEGTATPHLLSFTADNWQTDQTITVTGVDDLLADGDIVYDIALQSSSTDDAAYQGRQAAVAVTNDDDDRAGLLIDTGGLRTDEGGGSARFAVRLASQPTGPVTVQISDSRPGEARLSVTTLVFTPENWNQPRTVEVIGTDDDLVDGDVLHDLLLGARSADQAYDGETAAVAVINADNDQAGLIIVPGRSTTTEAGGDAGFGVALRSRPSANVTVLLTSTDAREGRTVQTQLTFTPDNWQQLQTVQVQGQDDTLFDGDADYAVTLATRSADAHYAGLAGAVALKNLDDDKVSGVTDPAIGLQLDDKVKVGDTARVLDAAGHVVATRAVTTEDLATGRVTLLPPDLDDGVYTFRNQVVDVQGQVVAEVAVTVTVVTDLDGIAPSVEQAAEGGDGNHDGIADWQQPNVSLLPLATVEAFAAGRDAALGSFGTICAGTPTTDPAGAVRLSEGAQLSGIVVGDANNLPADLHLDSPVWTFSLDARAGSTLQDADGGQAGQQQRVVIELPDQLAVTQSVLFWNAAQSRWTALSASAGLDAGGNGALLVDTDADGRADRLILQFTDGGEYDATLAADGRFTVAVALGSVEPDAQPVYSVLLPNGERSLTADPAVAAQRAAEPGARFEGALFDNVAPNDGGIAMQLFHQPFTGDWLAARPGQAMPYECYVAAGEAGFGVAASAAAGSEAFHLYLDAAGRTQLATAALAQQWNLAGQGYHDLGVQFGATRESAFAFDVEGYLIANRLDAGVQSLVQSLAQRFGSVSAPGFVDAVEADYLSRAVLVGLPHGDAAGVADLNAAFGTGFGA